MSSYSTTTGYMLRGGGKVLDHLKILGMSNALDQNKKFKEKQKKEREKKKKEEQKAKLLASRLKQKERKQKQKEKSAHIRLVKKCRKENPTIAKMIAKIRD